MKKVYLLVLTIAFVSMGLQAQTTLYEENFDSYTAGGQLADQAGDPWTTWSNAPGGAEDPVISDAQSVSPSNSANILAGNDCVLMLGDSTTGRYKFSFQIYIPTGKLGYYNLLQVFAGADSEWGTQTFFDSNGNGHIDAGGAGAGTFTFSYDTWILVENYVDLDNDWAEIFVDGDLVVSWQWSTGSFGGDPTFVQLGAANFYAWDNDGTGTPDFFIDDVLMESMPLPDPPSNLSASVDGTTITLNWDAPSGDAPSEYYVFRNGDIVGTSSTTTFEDTADPGTYTYAVKAYFIPNGLSQFSNEADAEVEGGAEREKVLLEIVTGTWCQYCPGAAMGADDLVENGHDVAVIEYHGGDDYETAQSAGRIDYYQVTGFPTSIFDGIDGFSGGSASESLYEAYLPYYNDRIALKSLFGVSLDVEQTARAYSFSVDASVEQLWDYTSGDLRLHVVLIESHIPENWLGLTEVNFVCREMYPDVDGQALTLENNGDTEEFNYEIEVSDDYDIANCELVAFIQDNETKEVLNTTMVDLGQIVGVAEQGELYSKIYPNPATDMITVESESTLKRISIYSLNGQQVYELALDQNKVSMNVDFLKSGFYMVKIETDNGTKFEKINVR